MKKLILSAAFIAASFKTPQRSKYKFKKAGLF
jgi:hypothetical protein